jgi:multidrug efflux pump subunit AcrB
VSRKCTLEILSDANFGRLPRILQGQNAQGEINGLMKGAVPAGYATEWTGQAQIMNESFGYLLETMVLSVIVIYMVLAAQFESVVHPFTIMLPSAAGVCGGAVGAADIWADAEHHDDDGVHLFAGAGDEERDFAD